MLLLLIARLQLRPADDTAAAQAIATILRLIRLVLWRRPTAQQELLDQSGVGLLGWLLLRLPAGHFSVDAVNELKLLLESPVRDNPPGSKRGEESLQCSEAAGSSVCLMRELQADLLHNVLCDFRIWARTQVEVQMAHLLLLREVLQSQVTASGVHPSISEYFPRNSSAHSRVLLRVCVEHASASSQAQQHGSPIGSILSVSQLLEALRSNYSMRSSDGGSRRISPLDLHRVRHEIARLASEIVPSSAEVHLLLTYLDEMRDQGSKVHLVRSIRLLL